MKIKIEIISKNDDELAHFKVHRITPSVEKAISELKTKDISVTQPKKREQEFLIGEEEGTLYRIPLAEILYIEVVDKKSFIYTESVVCQSQEKLYQLEAELSGQDFIRVAKSMLLNIESILAIKPTLSGRFEALLSNQEKVSISRKYVPDLKRALGMEVRG